MKDGILQRESSGGIQYYNLTNGRSYFINPEENKPLDLGLRGKFQSLNDASGGHAGSIISFSGALLQGSPDG